MSSLISKFDMFEDTVRSETIVKFIMIIAVPLFGVVAGYIASTGEWKIVALIGFGVVGLALAMLPRAIFWLTVVAAIFVAGLARMYVPAAEGVRWLVPLGAWWLAVLAFAHLAVHYRSARREEFSQPVPAMLYWAFAFMVVIILTGILHWPGEATFAKGIKGYFQMWGLLFALAFYPWPRELIDKLPRFFLLAAILQLPFVMHQYLFLVPMRVNLDDGVVAVDIISGTFGGQILGGGNNAVLSTFLMIVFGGLLALWKQGVMRWYVALPLALVLLVPTALNVSKISIFYALVVFIVLFGSDVIRSPKRFVFATAMLAGVLALLASAYTLFAPKELSGWDELIEYTYEGNVEKDTTSEGGLTRGGALRYWFQKQSMDTIPEMIVGYGAGATRSEEQSTRSTDVDDGPVDPELEVGRLAITALLWEGGLLSVFCIFGLFASAYFTAGRLARANEDDKMQEAIFLALKAGIAVLFMSLWHKNFFVFHIGFQAIFVLVFGYLTYWSRRTPIPAKKRRRRYG